MKHTYLDLDSKKSFDQAFHAKVPEFSVSCVASKSATGSNNLGRPTTLPFTAGSADAAAALDCPDAQPLLRTW